ncbi:MAG: sigma-70 family RNA polymerase sigma factor [Planctomycetota bacterium]
MSELSVTQILKLLRDGERDDREAAAAALFERYRRRVEQIARGRLMSGGGLADEQDVAQSAFRSFFGRIDTGQLDALVSGGQAWAILARLTRNKAIDSVRYENAVCRGGEGSRRQASPTPPGTNRLGIGDRTATESTVRAEARRRSSNNRREEVPLEAVRDHSQRSAEDEAVSKEVLEQFLEQLSEATLRGIVALKLEGFTNEEIGEKLGCATRTVERKLNLIRRLWIPFLEDSDEQPWE